MEANQPAERLLRAKEAAKRLECSARKVYRMVERGELPGIRYGGSVRISSVDLERYIDEHRTGNGHPLNNE